MGIRDLWKWLGNALRRDVPEGMDEELQFHLDMSTQRNLERGYAPGEARREALLQFGGLDRTREGAWDVDGRRWLEDALIDVRHSLRQLRLSPGFTISAVLTLALGIGANTAIFSVLDAVLLRPLPYGEPESLVSLEPGRYENFERWTADAQTIEASGAWTYSIWNVTSVAEPVQVWTLAVTSGLLPALGRSPHLGRSFSEEDDRPGAPPRVMLRYEFWQRYFAGDASIVGGMIDLNGFPHEVIGILAADLEFPPPARRNDGSLPRPAEVWTGVGRLPDLHTRGGFYAIGRVRDGASVEAVADEFTRVANSARAAGTDPMRVIVNSVNETVRAPLRPAVLSFAAGVVLVLLIACANLGSMLLARLAGREREIALRLSLGARRGRIARQILTEGAVLAIAGMLLGIAVAWLVLRTLLALAPQEVARIQQAGLNGRVLVFTLAIAVLTTVLIGLLPALRTMRRDPRHALGSARGSTVDRKTGRTHALLVAVEVAFAVVLLVGGGLLLRSFAALSRVSPGFPVDGLITADLLLPTDRYQGRAAVLQFFDDIEARLRARPGIESVSAIDRLPWGPSSSRIDFVIRGRPEPPPSSRPFGYNTAARPGYFGTIGIPVLQGREILETDRTDAPPVVVVSQNLADRYWPDSNPIGNRIEVFGVDREIVGVVGDVRHFGPASPVDPMIYIPQAQDITTRTRMTVVLRRADSGSLSLTDVREEIRMLDPRLPVSNLRSFGALRSERTAAQRFNALLVASFALLAALLAAAGIYGVMSFVVAQRIREIGIRMALGASRKSVLARFLSQATRSAGIGACLGIATALPLTRLIQSMLFGIESTDALTYAAVIVVVTGLTVLAASVPAMRAARVEPATVLAGD